MSYEGTNIVPFKESKVHKYRNRIIFNLAAQGWDKKQIADYLRIEASIVQRILSTRVAKNIVATLQKKWFFEPAKNKLEGILNDAIMVSYELMMDKRIKPEVRARVAQDIREAVIGRAQQTVDVKSQNLKDLFEQMDNLKRKNLEVEDKNKDTDILETICEESKESEDGEPKRIKASPEHQT